MLPLQDAAQSQDGGLINLILNVIDAMGEVGVGVLVFLESVIPPIPSEVVLPAAGMLVALGRLDGPLTWFWAMVGSVTGALFLYGLGAVFGEDRTRRALLIVPLVEEDDIDKAYAWFDRRGEAAVLIGRVIPGVRSLISLPAGVARMPLGRFTLMTAIGSGVWNTLLIGVGIWLGDQYDVIVEYLDVLDTVVVLVFGIAIGVFVMRRLATRRRKAVEAALGAEVAAEHAAAGAAQAELAAERGRAGGGADDGATVERAAAEPEGDGDGLAAEGGAGAEPASPA